MQQGRNQGGHFKSMLSYAQAKIKNEIFLSIICAQWKNVHSYVHVFENFFYF